MIDWKSKLTSRKFWLAVTEFVTLLIVALHGTEETATQVAAIIMAGASVIAYVIGEGLADAAGASRPLPLLNEYLVGDDEDNQGDTGDVDEV